MCAQRDTAESDQADKQGGARKRQPAPVPRLHGWENKKSELPVKKSGSDRMSAGKAVARPIDKGAINKRPLPVNKNLHPLVELHSSGNSDEQGHQRRPPLFPHKVQRHEKQYGADPLALS